MTIPRYFTVPSSLWSQRGLTPTERMVLATIDNLSDKDGRFIKGSARIACVLAIPRALAKDAVCNLISKGYITATADDKGEDIFTINVHATAPTDAPQKTDNDEGHDSIDYSEVLAKWKDLCPMLPAPRMFTDKMKRQLRKLLKNNLSSVSELYRVFAAIACSDFLTGRSPRSNWAADLHWLLRDTNSSYARILSGGFHKSEAEKQALASIIATETSTETYYR